jgi:hypothetical protein
VPEVPSKSRSKKRVLAFLTQAMVCRMGLPPLSVQLSSAPARLEPGLMVEVETANGPPVTDAEPLTTDTEIVVSVQTCS